MNPLPPADGTPSMSSSSSSSSSPSPLFCSSQFPMGCVQAKPSSRSPPRGIEKLKSDHGYVSGDSAVRLPPRPKPAAAESIPESPPAAAALRQLAPGEDELVDGWPRWLVNNIPRDVLAGLVPKSADSYVKIDKVGQGTYSNVYKARDRDSGKIVALKKVRFDTAESESVKFMAREIMILQKLDHPNVLKLEGLATSRMHYSLYLVFEFMQSDLTRIISRPGKRLTEPQIKCYLHQLLSGLQHCHERGILHRDIKGSNLLINKDGVLKIGDFGLANYFNPKSKRPLTNRVVTLWYRAPELLLGSTDYGIAIDLWSVGCLLAEMFFGRPIMPGRTEVEQLHRIFKLCGSPSGDYWRRLNLSSNFRPPQSYRPNILEAFKDLPLTSQRLIIVLLALEPSNRGTAASALQSDFFSTDPLACDLSGLPVLQNKEEAERNSFREQKRHTSFEPTKQQSEEVHERMLDQTANVLNGYSASTEALEQMEKPQVLQHIRSAENNFSAVNPNNNLTTPLKTLSSSSSPRTEPHPSDSNCSEHHPKKSTTIFQKRSSSSVFCRFSGDQMPKYLTSLNNANADGEGKADSVHRTVKRSNSTSEYINFSGEWISKSYTIVD